MSPLRFRAIFGASLVLLAGLVGATACGASFLDGLTDGTPDAGGARGDPVQATGCVGRVPPDGSTGPDGPSIGALSFAFQTVRLTGDATDSGAPAPVGYNLDHLCSCNGDRAACAPTDAGKELCDGDGGTDDAIATFFGSLATALPVFDADFAGERIQSGIFTVLVDVEDWNGLPEDPQVLIHLRMSPGIDRVASGGRKTPVLDGGDVWSVDPGSIVQGSTNVGLDCRDGGATFCTAAIFDQNAFVTNGRLYAHPETVNHTTPLVLQSSVGRIVIDLTGTTFDAALTQTPDGLWHMTGEIDGRWPVGSVLNTIANIENPLAPSTGVCETAKMPQSVYATLKTSVCAGLDLAASPTDDTKLAPCSAISSALSFVAISATAGHIVENTPADTNCLNWSDTCGN